MDLVQLGDWKNSEDKLSSECLICCRFQNVSQAKELALQFFQREKLTEDKSELCLDIHLVSMFVLRKLLNYPQYECEKLLENAFGVSPGDWFVLCERCLTLAGSAYRLQLQIEKLEKELKNTQEEAKCLLQGSTQDLIRRGVREDIRAFLRGINLPFSPADTVIKVEQIEDPLPFESDFEIDHGSPSTNVDSNSASEGPKGISYSPKKPRVRRKKLSSATIKEEHLDKTKQKTKQPKLKPNELKLLSNDPINRAKDIELLLLIRTYSGVHKTRTSCPICNKSVVSTIRLREHMKLHLSTTNLFPCKICQYPSQTQLSLERHITQCHKTDVSSKSISELESSCGNRDELVKMLLRSFPSNVVRDNDNPATCPLCNAKVTLIRSHLLLHGVKYQPFECKLCGHPSKGEKGLTFHMITFHKSQLPSLGLSHLKKAHSRDGPNRVKCNICGYTYSGQERLNKHYKSHKMFETTSCSMCKFPCQSAHALKIHFKLKHAQGDSEDFSEVKSNEDCYNASSAPDPEQESPPQESVPEKKVRRKDGPNRVQCDICGRTYSRRLFLNEHLRDHVKYKGTSCTICNYPCKTASSLKFHMKVIHDQVT